MTITLFGRGERRARAVEGAKKQLLAATGRQRKRRTAARPGHPEPIDPHPEAIRLMSLNIAHARSKARHQSLLSEPAIRRNLALIADLIGRESPHVVALQEADGPSSWSGSRESSAVPYERSSRASDGWLCSPRNECS